MAKREPKTEEQKLLNELINELTNELNKILQETIERVSSITKMSNVNRNVLNGIFGGKNNIYVDSVRTQFRDFNDFFAQWMKGLLDKAEYQLKNDKIYNPEMEPMSRASYRNAKMLQDKVVYDYVKKFLERNFYKNLKERTRLKPEETLWTVWFGLDLVYGLLIAPSYFDSVWHTDKSEIRRANFEYWTVGHAMVTGFIDPILDTPIRLYDLTQLYQFYQSQMKRISKSDYEKKIIDFYIKYLKESKNIQDEPLLIPELRYNGLIKTHRYRLDFTVLNVHTGDYTGFEISPASTHIQISNLKEKQVKVNTELKEKWGKEMAKRNEYFKKFEITIVTFTDDDLEDIESCFETIKEKLEARPLNKPKLETQLKRLSKM